MNVDGEHADHPPAAALQDAARQLIAAARAFLDAVEDLVEDDERVAKVAERVAGGVREAGDLLARAVRLADEPTGPGARRPSGPNPASKVRRIEVD